MGSSGACVVSIAYLLPSSRLRRLPRLLRGAEHWRRPVEVVSSLRHANEQAFGGGQGHFLIPVSSGLLYVDVDGEPYPVNSGSLWAPVSLQYCIDYPSPTL